MKKTVFSLILSVFFVSTLFAQQTDWIKRISMLPVTSETDSVTPVLADVLNDSVGVAARFLPGCSYITCNGETGPAELAAEKDLDFVISGRVVQQNGYTLELSVYDNSLGTVQTETVSINRSLEIFEVIDGLTEPVLNTVTGTELSYGALEFVNIGWPEAVCRMTINSVDVGTNLERISRLPVGPYLIKVEQLTVDGTITVLQLDVSINKNQMSTINYFTMEKEAPVIETETVTINPDHEILQSEHFSFLGEYKGHYYYAYSRADFTWEQARIICEELGGYLLSITSLQEQNKINNSIRRINNTNNYWLGLKYDRSSALWESGEGITLFNWIPIPGTDSESVKIANPGAPFVFMFGVEVRNNPIGSYIYKWSKASADALNGFILETETPLEIPE